MWVKAVHFTEYLVQCLFAFIMPATETGTARAADRIDLVDKDNGWRLLARTLEHVAYPRGTDSDEHFNKL